VLRRIYIAAVILLLGNLGMAQKTDRPLSSESQQIAVDAILDRANLALQRNQFIEAQKSLNSAEEIAIDSAIYARTQIVQTKFYALAGQLDEAKNSIAKLERIIPKKSPSYVDLMLVKASVHIQKKEFVEADEALKTINILLASSPNKNMMAQVEYLNAQLYLHTKNYDEAIAIYKRIIPQLHEEQLFYYEAKAMFNLSKSYFEKNELKNTVPALNEAISIARSFSFTGIELDCYDLKASVEKALGNFELALEYREKYTELVELAASSSLLNAENPAAVLTSVQVKDARIHELEEKYAKTESILKGRDLSAILMFVLLTLLSLLTLSLFKNNKLRARSNQALEGKNSALIDERDRAQDAAKIKADFLSTITHELRTPMYAVTGLTHLLLETEPRNDQKDHLETLQSSGEYLLSLIDNILDFNKLEANKVELEKIPFELKKRVEDITVSLSNQAKDQLNSLNLEFDPSIPSRINGDPVKISQILINLVGNAIKFTKSGTIWIRVSQIKQIDDKCLIHFEVEDNGKGISEEKQQDIFNNFTQEGSSTTREYGGTGLGLAIVKNLVELMGSSIVLDSKIGRGSIFSFDLWFELPDSNKFYEENSTKGYDHFTEVEEYPEYKKPERSKNQEEKAPAPSVEKKSENLSDPVNSNHTEEYTPSKVSNNEVISLKKASPKELISKKILIVEDNKINQMITRKILEGKNFDCDIANNGVEALGKIKETQYDLILMDIHMPVMDGKQCTREIRKFDRELPIIALTAVTLDESEKEFYEIGFDDIIPKPFKMNEFFEKIQKAFTNYQIY